MTAIGVDEYVWRHARRGDKHVTVIVDLTEIREGTGSARQLDMARADPSKPQGLADRPGPSVA